MQKIFNFLGLTSLLIGTAGSTTAFSSNHTLQSARKPNLKNGNASKFAYAGKLLSDEVGHCYLSVSDLKDYLADSGSFTSNHFWNWISGWSSDGWAHGSAFRDFFSSGNLDSLQELVNGTNTHIYTGDYYGDHYTSFDFDWTLSYIKLNIKLNDGIKVFFLANYKGPFSYNLYGALVTNQ